MSIKSLIKRGIPTPIIERYNRYSYEKKLEEYQKIVNENEKREFIFLLGTPLHGNLGDHAIAKAEIQFLQENFSNKIIIEIPVEYILKAGADRFKSIIKNSSICITGGGFLGTLWMSSENMVRDIIKEYKDNKILILPQTIYYEDSVMGKKELEKSKKIYSSHKQLYILAREQKSYEFLCKHFSSNYIGLVPDMVLYLNEEKYNYQRKGILICMRNDKEAVISGSIKNELNKILKQRFEKIKYTDTVIKHGVKLMKREAALQKKWDEFRNSELVITDRLHGMIFSLITGTPCIALNNLSGKVKGVYEWLTSINGIVFLENVTDLSEKIKSLKIDKVNYDPRIFQKEYQKILDILKN